MLTCDDSLLLLRCVIVYTEKFGNTILLGKRFPKYNKPTKINTILDLLRLIRCLLFFYSY